MDKNAKWLRIEVVTRTIKSLEENNMNGYYVETKEELISKIDQIVNEGSVVSCGGSVTLFETGVIEHLRSGRFKFLDRYKPGLSKDDIKDIYRKAFSADAYFASCNAVTENGELYNVDGTGNRVAAMMYGPDKVVLVCSINKIVKDVDAAIERNRRIAAPINAKRLNRATPCAKVGYCMDCKSKDRICNEFTLIARQNIKERIHVIFINDNVGY